MLASNDIQSQINKAVGCNIIFGIKGMLTAPLSEAYMVVHSAVVSYPKPFAIICLDQSQGMIQSLY